MGHVAPEAVHALAGPEREDVEHLVPGGRYGIKMRAAVPRVNTVIQFDGLVPVVAARGCGVAVVACCPCRELAIVTQVNTDGSEILSRDVIEIVPWVKEHHRVVVFTQVAHTSRTRVTLILTGHMVGHKVDDDLESLVVSAVHERLKFSHTVLDLNGHIGTHVIVVAYRVGGPSFALHHMGVAGMDALTGVVGCSGMLDDAGVPHMGRSE